MDQLRGTQGMLVGKGGSEQCVWGRPLSKRQSESFRRRLTMKLGAAGAWKQGMGWARHRGRQVGIGYYSRLTAQS